MKQIILESTSSNELNKLIQDFSPSKILLVTGKRSYKNSGAKDFVEIGKREIETVRFFDFETNPKYEDVLKGVDLIRKSGCNMIIAIGGGTVIDMAKLINVINANYYSDPLKLIFGERKIKSRTYPLFAIPTTAGTGSEVTHFAVVYYKNKKYSVAHKSILPDVAILNHQLTLSQSPYLTACAGLDALSQAVESYWSVSAMKKAKEFASRAIKLLISNLQKAVRCPTQEIRKAVLLGSHLAGKAINLTKTTAPHAISYPLTTFFAIPHGQAVFMLLPRFVVYNYYCHENDINDKRGVSYIRDNMDSLFKMFGVNNPEMARIFLTKFAEDIGVITSLRQSGIYSNYHINQILDYTSLERLANNPRKISRESLKLILEEADQSGNQNGYF